MSKRTGIKVQKNRTDDEFIMLPTVDFCFKELMRNEKVRKGIIAALLGVRPEEIKETRLLPTILRKEYEDDKYGILDVRVEMHDGTQIDFEMQVAEFDFWKKRIVFYLSKMVTDQIHKGDDYDKIQKCIHVSILDFVHFPEDNRYYRKITFCDTKNGRDLYRYHGDSCVGIGEVTTGRSERRRNHKVDAISQCKEPEGVKRDGKAGRVFWRSV